MNAPGILLVGNFLSSKTGTRSVGEELAVRLSSNGWRTIETSHQTVRILRLMDMLASVIFYRKKYEIAYVEVYSGLAFLWAKIVVHLLSLLHKPVVLALHGGGLVEFAHRHTALVGGLLQRGQIIVTPSLFLQAGLRSHNSAIRYLPNALDVGLYQYQVRSFPLPRIIWLRAFHEIYEPELAVRAIAFLAKEFQDISLTMIGPDKNDGSLSHTIKSAENLCATSHLKIVGQIPKADVPASLAKGDVFLNTTRLESFGVSVLEAALIGLPIVTTNVGELPLLWENEKTALLVPPGDAKAMANALKRVLTEPGLAERLSRNARSKAEGFDWSVVLPQWEKLFRELIKT